MIPAIIAVVAAALAGGFAFMRRKPRPPRIDPFTVGEPWRRHVSAAQALQRDYRELVRATPAGPLQSRMDSIGRQVDQVVAECYEIAKRGHQLDATVRRLNPASLRTRLEAATDDTTKASLQSQIDSTDRIRTSRDETDARLRSLTTRMGELVAQAAEVRVGSDATADLGTGVEDVVNQLKALREAVDDVNQAAARPTPGELPSA